MIISETELTSFLQARHATPHDLLGMHPATRDRQRGLVARALLHDAAACALVDLKRGESHAMERLAPEGFFEVFLPRRRKSFRYELQVTNYRGQTRRVTDPYSFLPTLGEQDLYLFNEGNEHRIYDKLGAHLRTIDGVAGVAFAVWAPGASQVSVVGNFNEWDGRYHPMRSMECPASGSCSFPG